MDTTTNNPASALVTRKVEATRIPMSLPSLKLGVPDIPGYHLHWMRGEAGRLQQAQKGGYEFVDVDEVQLNTFGVADGGQEAPGTDLGSRVSVVGGSDGVRMYLMKIKEEFWDEDQQVKEQQSERLAAQLRGDKGIHGPGDNTHRYGGDSNANIFQPKRRT